MNIGGLFIILFIVVGGVGTLTFVAAKTPMTAPVDSYGQTTSISDNNTRDNVTATTPMGITAGAGIVILTAAIILFSAIVYFAAAAMGKSKYKSRY